MRRFIIICIIGIVVMSCKKDNTENTPYEGMEISFSIDVITTDEGFVSTKDWECKPYDADYLEVKLNDVTYFLNVFRIGGNLYSENIRHIFEYPAETVEIQISKFVLWNQGVEVEVILPGLDDTIVMGTPDMNSAYFEYVTTVLPYIQTVDLTDRFTIPIEVLCFEDDQ